MSAKTYAGLNRIRPGSMSKTLAADGYAVVPFKDTDLEENVYRSRLGAPSNGSGPWMVVRRILDPSTPSTDGFGNVAAGPDTASHPGVRIVDYCLSASVHGYKISRSSQYPYERWNYRVNIVVYYYVWYDGPRTYRYIADKLDGYSVAYRSGQPCSLGFTYEDIARCYRDGDMVLAASIVRRVVADRYAELDRIIQDEKKKEFSGNRSALYPLTLDLAPPEAVYLEYLQDAKAYLELGILPGPWAMGFETAYIEAGKNLPQSATNVAANVLEVAHLLATFFSGRLLAELPTTAREAWLAYRYAYTTTKLDIRDFQSTFSRLEDLVQSMRVPTYGSYVRDGINYRVGYEVDTAQIIPRDVSTTLRKFGLELTALNVWDMIPFSFVVDWFLPISDIIEYFQDIGACRYEPEDLWWSITTVVDGFQIYVRLPGRKLSTMPYLQFSSAGSKTIALRIADAVALFAP